jgi:hypothetical protein
LNHPLVIFLLAFFGLWLAAWLGALAGQRSKLAEDERTDYGVVIAATLTLLGLIVGFSFSMATGRYDQRKNLEEEEANAIGTEYVRADFLPAAEAARVKALLKQYTDLRVEFYTTQNMEDYEQIVQATEKMQDALWTTVSGPVNAEPTPVHALVASGMNDVLNSQGYTQAAWWNRIPLGAWLLMFGIALFCNMLLGYGARRIYPRLLMVLPLVVAVSFFLIADIDSPRGGVIRVQPRNLTSLQAGFGK